MKLSLLLQVSSLAYLGIFCAGALMPRVVNMREHVATLPTFLRQLFWVYYSFIGLCLVGFGFGTFFLAEELASGTVLARAVCGFLAIFWALRFGVAHFVFDLQPYLTNRWRRIGLFAANTVFGCLPLVYGWVAWKGGAP